MTRIFKRKFICNNSSFFFFGYFLQKVSEKVGGAEGTKLDDDFKEMERVSLHHLDSLDIKSPSILRGEARKERGSCSPRAPENAKVTPKSTLVVRYIIITFPNRDNMELVFELDWAGTKRREGGE